jgi:hypothetical protein
MKNLLIYISPTGSFNNPRPDLKSNDGESLTKVQIENSLALGWKAEDILLVTNFEFQYGKFRAKVLPDVSFFEPKPQSSKINAIVKLFEKDLIQNNELYWFHDLDVFQLCPIKESELRLGKADMALTDYGISEKWNTGSIFFKKSSSDIFCRIKKLLYEDFNTVLTEEGALMLLTNDYKDIRKRVKKINKTYNFQPYGFPDCYQIANKPIKTAHFHPLFVITREGIGRSLNFFEGNNSLRIPLIPDRLVKIFKYHRIR